jgi:hypothetical protein
MQRMAEPAPLGPRRLWRAVIRPLVEQGDGDVVCDVGDVTIPEGLLVATEAKLHAVGAGAGLEDLAEVYRDRIVFHRSPAAAWEAVGTCRLAVLDVGRTLAEHIDSLSELAAGDGAAPPVLVQGLGGGRDAGAAALAAFSRRGWALVELPGFDHIRLVLPGGRRALDAAGLDAILERLRTGSGAQRQTSEVDERIQALQQRVRELELLVAEAEAGRELAQQRRATTEDLVATLRLFRDEARAETERARTETERARAETEDIRRLLDGARADTAAARARSKRVLRVHSAVREDLVRVQASQSWRLGHWLTRAARILTFRKPGRTDAVSKALERVDAITPTGDYTHR